MPLTVAAVVVMAILAGCSTAPAPSPTRDRAAVDASAAASDPSPGPILTGSPPPLNELEARIIDALQTLGIEGVPCEHSFRNAVICTPYEQRPLVHALPTGTDRGDFSVLSERVVESRTIRRVEYASGILRDRFECGDATYEIDQATPPGYEDFDAFLAEFIAALRCDEIRNEG
jgi:hypothetical protein